MGAADTDFVRAVGRFLRIMGVVALGATLGSMAGDERPWPDAEKGTIPGICLEANQNGEAIGWESVSYAYEVDGTRYEREYRCFECLGLLLVPEGAMLVEYRRADPGVSRPAGIWTEKEARLKRVALWISIGMLALGIAELFLEPPRRRRFR